MFHFKEWETLHVPWADGLISANGLFGIFGSYLSRVDFVVIARYKTHVSEDWYFRDGDEINENVTTKKLLKFLYNRPMHFGTGFGELYKKPTELLFIGRPMKFSWRP